MAKSANLYARIEPDVKEQAEGILNALGISASNAITMFYKQIILQRGMPFDVKLPMNRPLDVSSLTVEAQNWRKDLRILHLDARGQQKAFSMIFAGTMMYDISCKYYKTCGGRPAQYI